MPIIVLSLLRGRFFMHATCVRLLPVTGRSDFHRNALIVLQYGFITQKFVFVASRGLRPGPGLGLVSF